MAKTLQRPTREGVTPLVLEKVIWAGANMVSYQQAVDALRMLAEVPLVAKQVQRMTSQVGADAVAQRQTQVEQHRERPLMQRVTARPGVQPQTLAVVMTDGGRFQRRDHFRDRQETSSPSLTKSMPKTTHWREDKVGIVLSMQSDVHDCDPAPEFPEWLVGADVIADLAKLAASEEGREEESTAQPAVDSLFSHDKDADSGDWKDLAPEVLSRDVIASSKPAEDFGHHLEWKAWDRGIQAAKRQAFVADGLAVNWTIHKQHFSQMTGILDLMHALSYAWRAAAVLNDPQAYRRYATWIWQGQVACVIEELISHQRAFGPPPREASSSDPRQRIEAAITYYRNHAHLMKYPQYRQQGLPLTSSLMESTVKQMNARVKGTEKFWKKESGEAVLQLRADSLSDSKPLQDFWKRWRTRQTGSNTYRKTAA